MARLPPPITFAEGQRALYGWLIAAAGMFCGLAFTALILMLWLGWSDATESQRIAAIAIMGAGFPLGMLSVIVALAVGGPVGRIKVRATVTGPELEAAGVGETGGMITTTTTTSPTQPPSKQAEPPVILRT